MRVLQVLGRSAGGIARHVAQITEALDGDGMTVDVACPRDLPVAMPKPTRTVNIPDGPLWGHGRAVRTIAGLVEEGAYDVVHAHGLRAGIDASLAARRAGRRAVVTVHNLVHPDIAGVLKAPVYRRAEPLVVKLSDRTLAVSAEIARRLAAATPDHKDRIEVLHLGIGPPPQVSRSRDEIRRDLGLSAEHKLIVTVARLAPQKALHTMLDALARLPAGVHLAIAGEGPLEQRLRARAAELDLQERVTWLGFVADVADHIAAADVFCLSSIWEGVPLAAQEAILLGVPVVSTAVGGMEELISDGLSGRLVARGDPAALAEAIDEVLADRQRAARMAQQARADLQVGFSTEAMLARLEQLYAELSRAS